MNNNEITVFSDDFRGDVPRQLPPLHADTYATLANFALLNGDVQARQDYLDMADLFRQ
jgi:hypothetical protein